MIELKRKQIVSRLGDLEDDSFLSGLCVCHAGSLVARASSVGSCELDCATHSPHPHRTRNERLVPSEKLPRELGSRVASETMRELAGVATEEYASSKDGIEHRQVPLHEADGGVRLAGGRVGEDLAGDFDQRSASDGSTLPPPYSSHFGDTRYVCLQAYCCRSDYY